MNRRTFFSSMVALSALGLGIGTLTTVVTAKSKGKVYMMVDDDVEYMTRLLKDQSQLHMSFKENGDYVTYIVDVDRKTNDIVNIVKKIDGMEVSGFTLQYEKNHSKLLITFNDHIHVEFR